MPVSPITNRAVTLLPWEWQSREDILKKRSPMVPPGRALRKYEDTAANAMRSTGRRERTKPELTETEKIYSGARALAQASLGSLVSSGRAEMADGPDGKASLIRFRDRRSGAPTEGACETCHRPFVPTRQSRRAPRMGKVLYPRTGTTWGMPVEMRREAR